MLIMFISDCLQVLFGDDELKSGVVKLKDMAAKTEETVAVDQLVEQLKKLTAA